MDKITMLGTGHAMTMECFNTCFVYENENGKLLVDTGGGQQLLKQLRNAGVNLREINSIFISHQHTDHLLGLPWIFRSLGGPGGNQKLTLYMHEELMEIAKGILNLLLPDQMERLGNKVQFITVRTGDEAIVNGRKLRFFDLKSPTCSQYGFSMELGDGRKLVFHGDVPFDETNRAEIQGADYLMHEAFSLESAAHRGPGGPGPGPEGPNAPGGPGGPGGPVPGGPRKMGHSTVRGAAGYAESLGVKNLILFHGSDDDLENRQTAYTEEARQVYHGNIYVPYDLDVIKL